MPSLPPAGGLPSVPASSGSDVLLYLEELCKLRRRFGLEVEATALAAHIQRHHQLRAVLLHAPDAAAAGAAETTGAEDDAASFGASQDAGGAAKRKPLQPQRDAPPPPSSPLRPLREAPAPPPAAGAAGAESAWRSSTASASDDSVQSAVAPPAAALSSEDETAKFQRLKQWLKRHRLHKYASVFAQISYAEMLQLTEADLERMGINAQGARTKMLKKIDDLAKRNSKTERDLAQFRKDMQPGRFVLAIRGLSELLQSCHGNGAGVDAPLPEGFNVANELMTVLHKAFTSLVVTQSGSGSTSTEDNEAFQALLDLAIRHEYFSVQQKTQLFAWRSDCQKVLRNRAQGGVIGIPSNNGLQDNAREPWASSGVTPVVGPAPVVDQAWLQYQTMARRNSPSFMQHSNGGAWAQGMPPATVRPSKSAVSRARPVSAGDFFGAPVRAGPYYSDPDLTRGLVPAQGPAGTGVLSQPQTSLGNGDLFNSIWGQVAPGSGASYDIGDQGGPGPPTLTADGRSSMEQGFGVSPLGTQSSQHADSRQPWGSALQQQPDSGYFCDDDAEQIMDTLTRSLTDQHRADQHRAENKRNTVAF